MGAISITCPLPEHRAVDRRVTCKISAEPYALKQFVIWLACKPGHQGNMDVEGNPWNITPCTQKQAREIS